MNTSVIHEEIFNFATHAVEIKREHDEKKTREARLVSPFRTEHVDWNHAQAAQRLCRKRARRSRH